MWQISDFGWACACTNFFTHRFFLISTTQHYSQSLSMLNNSFKENPSTQKCSDPLFLTDGYFQYYIKFHQQFWDKKTTVRTIIIFHSTSSRIGRNQVYFHGCCRQKVKYLKPAVSSKNQHVILLSIMYFLSHYFCTLTKCKMPKKKQTNCTSTTVSGSFENLCKNLANPCTSTATHIIYIRNCLPQRGPGRIYRPRHHRHLHLPRSHHHQSEYQVCQSSHCRSLKL